MHSRALSLSLSLALLVPGVKFRVSRVPDDSDERQTLGNSLPRIPNPEPRGMDEKGTRPTPELELEPELEVNCVTEAAHRLTSVSLFAIGRVRNERGRHLRGCRSTGSEQRTLVQFARARKSVDVVPTLRVRKWTGLNHNHNRNCMGATAAARGGCVSEEGEGRGRLA